MYIISMQYNDIIAYGMHGVPFIHIILHFIIVYLFIIGYANIS